MEVVLVLPKTNKRSITKCVALSFHALSFGQSLPWTRCFAHSDNGGRPLHMAYARVDPHQGCFTRLRFRTCRAEDKEGFVVNKTASFPRTLNPTTNPLTAAALIYAPGAGITAGAGTRLVLQLLLSSCFNYYSFRSQQIENLFDGIPLRCLLNELRVGNFRACCPP